MNRRSILLSSLFSLGLLIAGCGGGAPAPDPSPGAPPSEPAQPQDTQPPRLLSQLPRPDEKEIPPDTSVQITFNEPIDPTRLDGQIQITASAGEAAVIEVECGSPCTEILITPQTPLRFDTTYTVRVDRIGDLSGNLSPAPISWSFTTEAAPPITDTTPPRLLSVSPFDGATGIDEGALVTLTFDEGIDPHQLNNDTFKLIPDGQTIPVVGTYGCDPACTVVTFAPSFQLRLNSIYRIEVTSGITDPAGNPLAAPYSGRFITRARPLPPPSPWSKEKGNRFNQHLYRADAISNHAWAAGERGLIVATSDAGTRWSLQESGTFLPLYGIDFVDTQIGFAAGGEPAGTNGFSNVIIKTADGGQTWEGKSLPPLPGVLKTIHFVDERHGWAAGGGGALIATQDGGEQWSLQQSGVTSELTTVDFVDADHGWAAGPGKVLLKTDDGGARWVPQFTFSSPIRQIDFIDRSRGWAVGDGGALLETADGGGHWTPISVTTSNLTDVRMTPEGKGWAVGDRGTFLRFDGAAWTAVASGTTISLKGVGAAAGESAWGVGDYGMITLASSTGKPAVQNPTATSELYGPFFIDAMNGWTVGSNARVFRTQDGGITWSQPVRDWKHDIRWTHLSNPARLCNKNPDGTWAEDPATALCIRTSNVHLYQLFFLTPLKGWAVGQPSLILHTEDGGQTWTEQTIDPYAEDCYQCADAGVYLRRIQFIDDQNGWAVGRYRTIYKTHDGGKTWKLLSNNWKYTTVDGTCTTPGGTTLSRMGGHLFGLSVNPSDPNDVFVAGGCCAPCNPESIIAHTTDGGLTWDIRTSVVWDSKVENRITRSDQLLPEIGRFHTFQMIGKVGWAAGRGGVLMQTEDRGATWNRVSTGTQQTLNDLFFIDPARGWLVGWMGTLLQTADGGKSWQRAPSGTRNDLFGVRFLNDQQGWIAGSGDLILANGS
ncbi:MAG: hypothetical protein EPO39_18395 [Candidatus Manganitrophaceae bacterium]|nr:MAG: hypothetical protein EPO39_18395 [Candidatus Manganitrophaceae bacterium]